MSESTEPVIQLHDNTAEPHVHYEIDMEGGSPVLTINGVPAAWYENWIKEKNVRRN